MAPKPRPRDRINPLDVPDRAYGRNPRALSSAVRRSVERTQAASAPARPARRIPRDVDEALDDRRAPRRRLGGQLGVARPRHPGAHERRGPETMHHKGGPGHRRPFPKRG